MIGVELKRLSGATVAGWVTVVELALVFCGKLVLLFWTAIFGWVAGAGPDKFSWGAAVCAWAIRESVVRGTEGAGTVVCAKLGRATGVGLAVSG